MIQLLFIIAQNISILRLEIVKWGQNKTFRALILGTVCLCKPNMTRDMIKKIKNSDFQKMSNFAFSCIFVE